jgi:hypothetical protein
MNGKLIAGVAAGAGALATYSYVQKMKRLQKNLQYIPTVNLAGITWNGITLRVNILLKNPTKAKLKIQFPFVKMEYKGTVIGSSQAVPKEIKIPANGEVLIDNVLIVIPVTGLFTVTAEVLKTLLEKKPVALTLTVMTDITVGWITVHYEEKKPITIRK